MRHVHDPTGITFSRRHFLAAATAWPVAAWFLPMGGSATAQSRPRLADYPFTLGVASGDPTSTGVVLWTRLAPRPLEPAGGMDPTAVAVRWELAEDDALKKIVAHGTALATPQLGHSVHVEADGLKPDRWYWFRFRVGEADSPIGRTRTLPEPAAQPERLRFAFASCQHYEQGLYTAYGQMARDDLDLVFHLGDYIYEDEGRDGRVRKHAGKEIESLDDYRIRYAQYKSDPLLQGMHAACPWFVTWDDHEVDNNYANDISEKLDVDPVAFLERRANAYQAYYENMPLRRRSLPRGPDMRLYRKAAFGRLAEFFVLDTRQHRTDQPNDDRPSPINAAALDPSNSLLGPVQRGWLQAGLIASHGTWNVLAQQVMMGMVGFLRNGELLYSMDQWPGYVHERLALVRFLAERRVPNPVVLTGDIHSNWVNDLRVDDRKPELPVVATEFVGTSISSGGNGVRTPKNLEQLMAINPCIRFHNQERGYVRCIVTPRLWQSDYVVAEYVTKPGGPVVTRASFVVEAGRPGAHPA
ncbi:MAG: alkaline phosphatase D family protein [Gemmataceae bacterium]|nr:alkaline phosphatase D family protein [Gemmataceae bacterium]MDW8266782.1 alkaline phosphatase D family protein [Gemmataceae bacterium]